MAGGITAIGTALKNMGIPKDSVLCYETALKFGKFILLVHGTAEEVAHAQNIMQTQRAHAILDREVRRHLADQEDGVIRQGSNSQP